MMAGEHVSGTIIGGDWITGQLWANGEPQFQPFTADDTVELIQLARKKALDCRRQLGDDLFNRVYPGGFELRY